MPLQAQHGVKLVAGVADSEDDDAPCSAAADGAAGEDSDAASDADFAPADGAPTAGGGAAARRVRKRRRLQAGLHDQVPDEEPADSGGASGELPDLDGSAGDVTESGSSSSSGGGSESGSGDDDGQSGR